MAHLLMSVPCPPWRFGQSPQVCGSIAVLFEDAGIFSAAAPSAAVGKRHQSRITRRRPQKTTRSQSAAWITNRVPSVRPVRLFGKMSAAHIQYGPLSCTARALHGFARSHSSTLKLFSLQLCYILIRDTNCMCRQVTPTGVHP